MKFKDYQNTTAESTSSGTNLIIYVLNKFDYIYKFFSFKTNNVDLKNTHFKTIMC